MNFFKSVFSDPDTDPNEEIATGTADENVGAWSFGGLIKTISAKSESVMQTYRRDIEEFRSELKKETAAIREAAARVVLDLPGSLESGASIAQESLETVGQAIDEFGNSVWRGATEIISLSKDALLVIDSDGAGPSPSGSNPSPSGASSKYNRHEARLLAVQSDPGTFREEPEDCEEFTKWKEGFLVEEKDDEIQVLLHESNAVGRFHDKMVPFALDYETFWSRYFYRVHKLKQVEDARSNLVKRVISREDDEDLSWEVEEDDDVHAQDEPVEALKVENLESDEQQMDSKSEGSCKDSDFSVVSSQPSMPGEDDELDWDEIEDLGEHQDEESNGSSGSSNRVDLRERGIVGVEDEDLNWDIEDDVDDTAKA